MDFSVAKTIDTYVPTVASNYHFLSDQPSIDNINPGINVQLFSEIVPVPQVTSSSLNQIKHEISHPKDTTNEQSGGGLNTDNFIKESFQHPRPVDTQVIELFHEAKIKKRKAIESEDKPKKKTMKHKFQFV